MIDAELRTYLKAAQGDEPPARWDDPRWAETEALARHLIDRSAAESALKSLEQEPARKKRWDLLLLAALLHEGLGERTRSLEPLEVVADKLLAAGDREGVRALLPRFLEPDPSSSAVRFLHYLAAGDAPMEERIDWLRTAIDIRSGDPELHAELAARLAEAGEAEDARDHRLRSLELTLDGGRFAGLTDAMIRAIEEDLEFEPVRVARLLLRYAAGAPWDESEPILDLALPELETRVPGRIAWSDLAPLGPRLPGTPRARALVTRLLGIVVAHEPRPDAILRACGIADPAASFDTIADRLPKILALPPGAYVNHQTWGVGRVVESDGESVLLDFSAGRTGHKMSFAMASRSLDRLPHDGLRVLGLEDPDRLRRMAGEGDPEVLVRALRDVGGAATQAQLKPRLEGALAGHDWSGWWRKAKERWKTDLRIDASEGYRGQFRLAPEGVDAADTVLPRLAARASSEGLQLIRKFLRDHPEQEERIKEHAGALVARWAEDDRLEPTTRAQALCHALSWGVMTDADTRATLDELIESGLRPDDLALGVSQEQLLDLSHGAALEEEFLWRAMESRLPRLRDLGRGRLRALLGPDRYAKAIELRIARPTERPVLAARLIEHFASRSSEEGSPAPEWLLVAAVRLLEGELAEGTPERITALLSAGGPLETSCRKNPPGEEATDMIERTALHWAGSERRLLPVLELLHRIGLAPIADEYERRRKARAHGLLEGRTTEDIETRFTLMSRATYDRLQEELSRTARDLKTVIPAAIETARALGDLRENAEYEAAKQRQANAAARVQELMTMIQRARLIETIDIDSSRVGVGTETTLQPLEGNGTNPLTLWILGEGDSTLAPGILSYRAPLARPLLGKEVGAEVELLMEDGPRRFRVDSIKRRLPGEAS
jgi:transcription elongation factor GreA